MRKQIQEGEVICPKIEKCCLPWWWVEFFLSAAWYWRDLMKWILPAVVSSAFSTTNKKLVHLRKKWKIFIGVKCAKSLQLCQFFVTSWTVACQAFLSMGFSRQEYWSELPCPSPEDFQTRGSNPGLLCCRWMLYNTNFYFIIVNIWNWFSLSEKKNIYIF